MRSLLLCTVILGVYSSAFAQANPVQLTQIPSKIIAAKKGGRGGYSTITINKDSTIYESYTGGVVNKFLLKTNPTSAKDWTALIKNLDLEKMELVSSGKSRNMVDGSDFVYIVETGKKTYSLVNPNESSAEYLKIAPFIDILKDMQYKLWKESLKL